MDGFTYILFNVWLAWCQVFVSGKLIHACYIHQCSIVEVVVDMLCVPGLFTPHHQLVLEHPARKGPYVKYVSTNTYSLRVIQSATVVDYHTKLSYDS